MAKEEDEEKESKDTNAGLKKAALYATVGILVIVALAAFYNYNQTQKMANQQWPGLTYYHCSKDTGFAQCVPCENCAGDADAFLLGACRDRCFDTFPVDPLRCSLAGAKSQYPEGNNGCDCKHGYTGVHCEKCVQGWGPGYPCCGMRQFYDGEQYPCITDEYDDLDETARELARECSNGYAKCFVTPTYTGQNDGSGWGHSRYWCEAYHFANTDEPYTYVSAATHRGIDHWRDHDDYVADYQSMKNHGKILKTPLFCKDVVDPEFAERPNYDAYDEGCVLGFPTRGYDCTVEDDGSTLVTRTFPGPATPFFRDD